MPSRKLSLPSQMWVSHVTPSDIDAAIEYATISLPWTFDRMRYGPRTQRAVNDRMFHIMIGVLNQTILSRILTEKGFTCKMDWTNYRESDIFDFSANGKVYDVKTTLLYGEYDGKIGRRSFTPELLIANRAYPGPEWKHFFPVGVTISQLTVDRKKDSYIFGIARARQDLRKTEPFRGDEGFWCAAPFLKARDFFHSTPAILAREEETRGFFAKATWKRSVGNLFGAGQRKVELTLYGEWKEEPRVSTIALREGQAILGKQELSSLACIRLEHPSVLDSFDRIEVEVDSKLDTPVPKSTDPRINLNDPDFLWRLDQESFVNLRIPPDYALFWLGHISFVEFSKRFQTYPAYFIPSPKEPEVNTKGRPSNKLMQKLRTLDRRRSKAIEEGKPIPWPEFASLVSSNEIHAGLLIAAQRPNGQNIGAACYYYPPYGFLETAIYVLPHDLAPMETLGK